MLIGLLIIGLSAGIMAGMFGLGGGAILVPALVILLGLSQTAANGTSLVVLALPVGLLGCVAYYRAGKLRVRPALALALGIAVGSWFGAGIALGLPPALLSLLYGLFLAYIGWRYIAPLEWLAQRRGVPSPPEPESPSADPNAARTLLTSLVIGGVAGIFAGMFGIGGGVIIITGLILLLKFDQKLATGTSLGALLLPATAPSAYRYWLAGEVDLDVVVPVALALTIGALLGARVTLRLPDQVVQRAFGVLQIVISLRFLFVGLEGLLRAG